ncbi:MAG: hypothetical protein IKF38_00545 [Clostridia bacterium]|nr:hypothetical protein [Clostridia bacterium]
MYKNELANKLKQTKGICTRHNPSVIGKASTAGITLIALVITIIVLLILAGVSISAITGNESAMGKAKEAKVKSEASDELDTIKLAVVEAVAHSTDGYVSGPNLANALDGIISSDQIPTIRANVNGPTWLVTGSKGKYEISRNGQVEALSGIELSQTAITFTEGATNADVQLTATLTADLMGSTITWSSNNTNVATVDANGKVSVATNMQEDDKNTAIITAEIEGTTNVAKCTVTFVETEIYKIEVTVTPSTIVIGKNTGTATTVGKGILGKDFGEITSGVSYTSGDISVATVSGSTITGVSENDVTITATKGNCSATVNVSVEEEPPFILGEPAIGSTVNYGKKVIDYKSNAEGKQDEIGWRLFYQDTEGNTYLIAMRELPTISKNFGNHTGANISNIGKGLNPLIKEQFAVFSTKENMKFTSWFTDPDEWRQYTDTESTNKVSFAIASPTIELLVKSYNAVAQEEGLDTWSYPTFDESQPGYAWAQSGKGTDIRNGIYCAQYISTYQGASYNAYGYALSSPRNGNVGYNSPGLGLFNLGTTSATTLFSTSVHTGNSGFNFKPVVCLRTNVFEQCFHLQ